ncbi:MAG: ATP-binding protein [Streptosporangiaceae bacterium]
MAPTGLARAAQAAGRRPGCSPGRADELGYVQVDPRGAELLFQIITERDERASIAIGTNLPFSEWGTVFPDPRLVAAIVDRVTFNAHILETGTQSYRLRTSKTTTRSRKPS